MVRNQRRRGTLVGSCLASLGLIGVAQAAAQAGEIKAGLENLGKGGAAFSVEGTVDGLPDGTALHVTLKVKGSFSPPIEAAFFQVTVKGGAYSARKTWDTQTFPPMAYEARVDLLVSEQNRAIVRFMMRKKGFSFEHREVLATSEVSVGTSEETLDFERETLRILVDFVDETETIRKQALEATAVPADGSEAWVAGRAQLMSQLGAAYRAISTFVGQHIVLRERPTFDRVKAVHNEITRSIEAHAQGKQGRRGLRLVGFQLDQIKVDVSSRLRKLTAPPPEPPGDAPPPQPPADPSPEPPGEEGPDSGH